MNKITLLEIGWDMKMGITIIMIYLIGSFYLLIDQANYHHKKETNQIQILENKIDSLTKKIENIK